MAKAHLKVVEKPKAKEAQETTALHIQDVLHQGRAKLNFMSEAIIALWGHPDTDFSGNEDLLLGCQLAMYNIEDDLEKVQTGLDAIVDWGGRASDQ